jgi:hypothetical protein
MPMHLYISLEMVPMPTQEVNFTIPFHKSAFSRGTFSLNGLKLLLFSVIVFYSIYIAHYYIIILSSFQIYLLPIFKK